MISWLLDRSFYDLYVTYIIYNIQAGQRTPYKKLTYWPCSIHLRTFTCTVHVQVYRRIIVEVLSASQEFAQ